mmetsp:Transcript_63568/g.185870  ORF Transcript_63568/g.185870 Transcript_63568/m.185870 type:complete len:259 (-) Transcript_63568:460-1236(-)
MLGQDDVLASRHELADIIQWQLLLRISQLNPGHSPLHVTMQQLGDSALLRSPNQAHLLTVSANPCFHALHRHVLQHMALPTQTCFYTAGERSGIHFQNHRLDAKEVLQAWLATNHAHHQAPGGPSVRDACSLRCPLAFHSFAGGSGIAACLRGRGSRRCGLRCRVACCLRRRAGGLGRLLRSLLVWQQRLRSQSQVRVPLLIVVDRLGGVLVRVIAHAAEHRLAEGLHRHLLKHIFRGLGGTALACSPRALTHQDWSH